MYTAEIVFQFAHADVSEEAIEYAEHFLGTLRMNGQICGDAFPSTLNHTRYLAYALIPEQDALNKARYNKYVQHWHTMLRDNGLLHVASTVLGEESGLGVCECAKTDTYILYMEFLSLESPLRCGTCFAPAPLYRLPPTIDEEYHDIISWKSDYEACARLYLNDTTAQRSVIRELTQWDSALSTQGIAICQTITRLTTIPTYYYLFRHGGRSLKQERARRCPANGKEWLLAEPWHGVFDFRCNESRLLSNIGYDVRK